MAVAVSGIGWKWNAQAAERSADAAPLTAAFHSVFVNGMFMLN